MPSRSLKLGLTLLAGVCACLTNAQVANQSQLELGLEEVLKSTLRHHPLVQETLFRVEERESLRFASEGAFDWQIEQDSFSRTSGFYSGWYADQRISRRLENYTAKVSAGYRVSDGTFPVYEEINETLSGGEANIKLSLSLLRDRDIDSNRNRRLNTQLDIDIARQGQRLELNQILFEAGMSYLAWYQANMQKLIAGKALSLAKDRQEAIQLGVNNGDLAQIELTEFDTSLMNRQASFLSAEQRRLSSAIQMGLFLRDAQGVPTRPTEYAPKLIDLKTLGEYVKRLDRTAIIEKHPSMLQLDEQLDRESNDIRLGKNKLLPKLDLEVVLAEDFGAGSNTLQGFESYVGLSFSVPIEQRQAKGELSAKRAKLTQLKYKKQQIKEKLDNEIENAYLKLQNLQEVNDIRHRQAELAEHLVVQEQHRFRAGDSDLFLLNTRENRSVQASIAALNAELEIVRQQLALLSITAQLSEWLQNRQ